MFSVAVVLHVIGLNFISKIQTNSLCSPSQKIHLLTLCCTEILFSLSAITKRVVLIFNEKDILPTYEIWHSGYLNSFYISVMILLTIDRLLAVFLNIKYSVYCTAAKAKLGILFAFVKSVTISLVLTFFFEAPRETIRIVIFILSPVYNFTFIFIAFTTYSYMYVSIVRNRKKQSAITQNLRVEQQQEQKRFKKIKRGFYFPTLLIITFFIFWVCPDLTYMYFLKFGISKMPSLLQNILTLFYPIGLICDAFLYMFFPRSVRKKIWRMFKRH